MQECEQTVMLTKALPLYRLHTRIMLEVTQDN